MRSTGNKHRKLGKTQNSSFGRGSEVYLLYGFGLSAWVCRDSMHRTVKGDLSWPSFIQTWTVCNGVWKYGCGAVSCMWNFLTHRILIGMKKVVLAKLFTLQNFLCLLFGEHAQGLLPVWESLCTKFPHVFDCLNICILSDRDGPGVSDKLMAKYM